MSSSPESTASNRKIIAVVVALVTVVAVVLSMAVAGVFSVNPKETDADAKATSSASETKSGDENKSGDSESKPADDSKAPEVSEELRQVVDSYHRNDANDPRAIGSIDAPIVIEMFSDYRCGHCQDWMLNTLPKLQPMIDDGTIRIEANFLPFQGDDAVTLAQAGWAAALQGKFWEFGKEVYTNVPGATDGDLKALAKKLGMDPDKFLKDTHDPETVKKIAGERDRAVSLGINGTPAFLVGYSYLSGAYPIDAFHKAIDAELKRPIPYSNQAK